MVTAVTLPPLDIWNGSENGTWPVINTLQIIAMLSLHRQIEPLEYPGDDVEGQLNKNLSPAILTETNKRVLDAEKRAKMVEEQLAESRKLVKKLEAKLRHYQQ